MSNEQPAPAPPARRTKRRYAHELYPHAEEDEIRPLSVEVPYLYARAIGQQVMETSWSEVPEGNERMEVLIQQRHLALLADALLQGKTGDEAWKWAEERMDPSGELVWDRAVANGVDPNKIKPYPCGPEPDTHYCQPDAHGRRFGANGPESQCERCTEPDEMKTYWCRYTEPTGIPRDHVAENWPDGMKGWVSGYGHEGTIWCARVDAANEDVAKKTVTGCYGPSADLIFFDSVKENDLGWRPGGRFPE